MPNLGALCWFTALKVSRRRCEQRCVTCSRWLRWDHFTTEIWIFEKETLDLYCGYELRIVCVTSVCVWCVFVCTVYRCSLWGGPVIGIQDPRTCICKNLIDIRIIMKINWRWSLALILPSVGAVNTAESSICRDLRSSQRYLNSCRLKNDFDFCAERRLEAACVTNCCKL